MAIGQAASNLLLVAPPAWTADWAWGLPLIVVTVVMHVFGLGLISQKAALAINRNLDRRYPTVAFMVIVGATTLLATCLHAAEAAVWAVAYRLLGALPDNSSSMLYSLNAMTSYGHTSLELEVHWHLMGALEALNGWLLFGLTAAFLFAVIQQVWSSESRRRHK